MVKERELSVFVPVHRVFWHPDFNGARQGYRLKNKEAKSDDVINWLEGFYGTKDEKKGIEADPNIKIITNSLTEEGWWDTGDGIIEVESMKTVPEQYPTMAMDILTNVYKYLQDAVSKDPGSNDAKVRLEVFTSLYVDPKTKKPYQPDLMGISGNRRSSCLFRANVNRKLYKEKDNAGELKPAPKPLVSEIPVIIRTFASARERLENQIRENEDKTTGFQTVSAADRILGTRKLVSEGANQGEIRRIYKDTMGQKLFGIVTLDNLHPKLDLVNRIINLPESDPKHIRFDSIQGKFLPKWIVQSNPRELAKENQKLRNKGDTQLPAMSVADLEKKFEEFKTGKSNNPKTLAKDRIEAIQVGNRCNAVKKMASAVLEADPKGLSFYDENSKAFNDLESLCEKGQGPEMETILGHLVSLSKNGLNDALEVIKKSLKIKDQKAA